MAPNNPTHRLKMETQRFQSTTSTSWQRLPIDLPSHDHIEQALQVAWLLLLSIYDNDPQPSCYLWKPGKIKIISLTVDKTLTLAEHIGRLERAQMEVVVPQTVVWCGTVDSFLEWAKTKPAKNLEMALVVDTPVKNDSIEFDPSVKHALAGHKILLAYKTAKMPTEEATSRISTLSHLLISPTTPLKALSLHDTSLIKSFNTPLPSPGLQTTIPTLFSSQVEKQPNAPAIHAWDGEMSYAELEVESRRVASRLGAGEGMVLFCMRKSKWAVVAALGILKAGRAIVPVDPDWPRARMEQIVEITGSKVAVCDEGISDILTSEQVEKILIPPLDELSSTPGLVTGLNPDSIAFTLFSSGSTGLPKGMLRTHSAACTAILSQAPALHLTSSSRVLQFASHVFDVAMLDFFTTLLSGGCICIPSEIDRRNDLAGFINRSGANWALLTPTVADILEPKSVPGMKFVTLGGEVIREETLRKWKEVCDVGINYGSAEVDITHVRDVGEELNGLNVGKRLGSCAAFIVDPEDASRILPVGAVGELVIAGPTMAKEYLNAPEKTAEVFLPTPQSWLDEGILPEWMSRIYLMGDLFRQRFDGSLEFVSRKDFQVKVNGQKVELPEIERSLALHPAVKQCAVLYPSIGPYAKRLVAVVQPAMIPTSRAERAATSPLTFQTLNDFLSQRLPSYMLPTVLIMLRAMPHTPTMKVDRVRLKAWLTTESDITDEILHISTALNGSSLDPGDRLALEASNLVADIIAPDRSSSTWKSISGHDHALADIGLDSAQMMRLAALIHKRFGVRVYTEILGSEGMTIRGLAKLLAQDDSKTQTQSIAKGVEAQVKFLQSQVEELSRSVLDTVSAAASARRVDSVADAVLTTSLPSSSHRVFLTGATGYLGVQILLQLLKEPSISRLSVLVRATSTEQAVDRIKRAIAATSHSPDLSRLIAWPGDLSKPRLGLAEGHWNKLSNGSIDTIVHCGAIVHWTKSYATLESANVLSTCQLLTLSQIQNLIFVSGGRYPSHPDQSLSKLYETAARGSGYAQSKFVAEQIVDTVRQKTDRAIQIVVPAYLIGPCSTGYPNRDDYLWRVVWSSVRAGAYNASESEQWLFVSAVDFVAARIVELATAARPIQTLEIKDGLQVQELWQHVGTVLGIKLMPVDETLWLRMVRKDMDTTKEHLLWPLSETLENSRGRLTEGRCRAADVHAELRTDGVDAAVRRNVEHLRSVGFFGSCRIVI